MQYCIIIIERFEIILFAVATIIGEYILRKIYENKKRCTAMMVEMIRKRYNI